jgi:eukaryotic-like serine/threonine-protein kinase
MSPSSPPLVAGRFQAERFAGAGGMGTVFRAVDHSFGQPVALKLINSATGDVDRFAREAEVLAT